MQTFGGIKVEWVMGDRHMSRKVKGYVLSSCVIPTYMNALETTEKQQVKVQVRKNNLVRRIVGAKKDNKRRLY